MPVATAGLLRGVLALLAPCFAYFLGRALAGSRRRAAAWGIRSVLALLGLSWRAGLDALTLAVLVLSAAACALGVYQERRPKQQEEDLTHVIFPPE